MCPPQLFTNPHSVKSAIVPLTEIHGTSMATAPTPAGGSGKRRCLTKSGQPSVSTTQTRRLPLRKTNAGRILAARSSWQHGTISPQPFALGVAHGTGTHVMPGGAPWFQVIRLFLLSA